jgi:hypothetical protein
MFASKSGGGGRRYRLVPSGGTVGGGRADVGGGRSAVVAGDDGDGDGGTVKGLLVLGDLDGLADSLKGDADDLQGRNSIGGGESSGATAGLGAQDDLAHLLQDMRVNVLTLVAGANDVDGVEATAAADSATGRPSVVVVVVSSTNGPAIVVGAAHSPAGHAYARPGVVVAGGWLSAGQSGQACEKALKAHENPDF